MFHPNPDVVAAGIQVMFYGLLGVFTVLILFFFSTKLMVRLFTKLDHRKKARQEAQ